MKTHKVVDVVTNEDVFVGTVNECNDWKSEQKHFGYLVQLMKPDEIKVHNVPERPTVYSIEFIDADGHDGTVQLFWKEEDANEKCMSLTKEFPDSEFNVVIAKIY